MNAPTAATDPTLTLAIHDAREFEAEFVTLLRRLVTAESPTGDVSANQAVASIIEPAMTAAGGRVERHEAPGYGTHLVGRFRGARSSGRPLLVVGHMDTVHPVGTLGRLPWAIRDGRIYGPGVYDMKSGVTATLVALRALRERKGGPATDITFVVTCDEERGSRHSRPMIETEARRSRAALVVEPPVPGGGVKSRRKGVSAYVLHVRGRAAHAGIEPEAGASAVHEIARQVCAIHDLADVALGTTVSVGVIEGGTAENVVAEAAQCTIDVRFWEAAEAERVDRALRAAKPADPRCTLKLEGGVNRGALERTQASAMLIRGAAACAAQLGFDLGEGSTGGGSDGNLTSAVGCPTLDGLGLDGAGAHTVHEHILASDIPRRIALLAALFERL